MTLFLLALVVGGLALASVALYNQLVTLRNRYANAYAQIDVQLKRRHDLIPNLVETVRGYLAHERETLEKVIGARQQAADARRDAAQQPGDPEAMRTLGRAEANLTGALGRLDVVVEAYPNLKADASVRGLMDTLRTTENRVAFSRQAYNDAVMRYNTKRETLPSVVVARAFAFGPARSFEVLDARERTAPRVSLDAAP